MPNGIVRIKNANYMGWRSTNLFGYQTYPETHNSTAMI